MAETAKIKVAEGPLIRHIPGGYAEFLQRESGLPPARLIRPEGEWWAKLVDTPAPSIKETVPVDTGDTDPTGPTDSPAPGFDPDDLSKESPVNWDYYDDPKIEPYGWKTDYTPVDWDVNYNEVPKGYGWGVPTDSPLPYQGGAVGEGPSSRGAVVPGGQGDRLTTRGSAGLEKPLVEFEPSPTEYAKGYDPSKTFVEKPGAINKATEDLKAVATDGLALGEKWIDAIAGKTAADFKPRNPKEAALFNKFKKGYEIFVAAIKEGGGVFGGTLYETGGGRTTMPDTKTGEVPQAHFPNILKTLKKVFAGEKNPIVMQEYGDLHWATIIATIGMANTYGPIVWAIPGLRTMADTIGASMNGMLMDKPNLEGNPIQDTMHRLFWIAGQAGQKVYDISIGKLAEKLRGTPKSDKTRGTISEELNDLVNIKDAFKAPASRRIKIKLDPEFESAGQRHLQPHDPLISETIGTKPGPQITAQVTGEQPAQPIGTTAQPIRAEVPVEREPIIQGPTGTSGYTQIPTEVGQATAKTITPHATQPPSSDPDDRLTDEQLAAGPEIQPEVLEAEIAELADAIMGEVPTGDKKPFQIKGDYQPKQKPDPPPETTQLPEPKVLPAPRIEDVAIPKTIAGPLGEPQGELPIDDRLTQEQLEAGPDIRQVEEDLPEIKPETLEELKEQGITPAEDPVDPYATYSVMARVPVDEYGQILDYNNPADMERLDRIEDRLIEFPDRGKDDLDAGREQSDHEIRMNEIELDLHFKQPDPDPTGPTEPTGPHDFRSDYQKELGLTVGNQWADESDRSTWSAIEATQTYQWNERTQQFDLKYNRNLPQSNIPGHPQYYENNPEYVGNVTPDVNVDWTPAGGKEGKEEIFNWSDQAGLQPTIYKPMYDNDYQFIGNEMFMLETESYPKGDGWGYRYRYNSAETGERGEWREWEPGP
ncbi:hypothetical protein CMI37_15560 [Candidatus Pacearchaeota archaeon]|nr:hypothetical protein [Candidatus Pacearchaeota archaeon]